jgi:hypothetical protein
MYFEATFDEEGVYPIRMRTSAPALYEKDYDTDAEIRVEVADDGPVERITDLIAEGAILRDRLEQMDDGARRRALVAFLFQARTLADADYRLGPRCYRPRRRTKDRGSASNTTRR